MFKTGCDGGDGYDGCVSDDGCDSCVSCGSCYGCVGCYGCYGRYGCGSCNGCVCVSSYWCRAYCSECNFVRISTSDASTLSHNTLSKFVDSAASQPGASDGISPSVALTLATPAAYYAGCCGYPAGSASCCGYTTEGGSIGVASAVADGTGAFACSLSFFARVMAFFAAKFSPDNEARCGYSWQRRTNNDEQRGSSRSALATICAAKAAGSGTQTRASNAACATSNKATRQRGNEARCANSWQRASRTTTSKV